MTSYPRLPGDRFVPSDVADALRAGADRRDATLTGVTDGALPYLAALLPAALERPVLLVVATRQIAEATLQDSSFYARTLVPDLPRPLLLPALEPEPYLGVPPHLQVVVERTLAQSAAASGQAPCLIAPAEALLLRVPGPDIGRALTRTLHIDDTTDRDDLVRALITAGYRRQDMVGLAEPYRIELDGDRVDGIRTFDPVSQRSRDPRTEAVLLPLVPFPIDADSERKLRDWGERLPDSARDDLRQKRLELRERLTFPGHEYYAPAFAAPLQDLATSLPDHALVVVEAEAVAAELEKARGALEEAHKDAVAAGHAVPTPDELALTLDEITALVGGAHVRLESLPSGPEAIALGAQPARRYEGRIKELVQDLAQDRAAGIDSIVVVPSQAEAERVEAMLSEYELPYLEGDAATAIWRHDAAPPTTGRIAVTTGRLAQGMRTPRLSLAVHAAPEVFGGGLPPVRRRRRSSAAFASDFRDLKVGDHVVHVDHGISRFLGLKTVEVGDAKQEFMVLAYHGDDKLYVPLDRLDLVQKFSGVEGVAPRVDALGGTAWARVKTKVKRELKEMAGELLKLYASRRVMNGHSFAPDGLFQQEFEDAFPYTETPDQLVSIQDVKRDMESGRCMDRLLCGDVGYGKTEVAMRAAFKAIADGKQVAVLAPTTVLALQHFRTFTERFKPFPVLVDMVSRFRKKKDVDATFQQAAAGKLDIMIGTHRMLRKDLVFRDLGLLIVDEEQRFGVTHKEKLKQLKKGIDVLTMSATPIPRTLQMSLAGMRDMSLIQTPPDDRLAIETTVMPFQPEVLKDAVKHELERGGQVFFVHNRVESIFTIADTLRKLVPFARIAVGHGQMREGELEDVMVAFMERQSDILLATTIIENGLDLPNVNTIIINQAHRLGLAQLYQLRGRVGRSDRPAYAYLLVPPKAELTAVARRRLAAIYEFSELGSGFRIAALDLEIRGAGNLLGREQSGHIAAVGFDMFLDLLEQTVRELKGEVPEDVQTKIDIGVDVAIPVAWVPESNQRLMLYKRIAGARAHIELDELEQETADRFGAPPDSVRNLFEAARLKLDAQRLGVQAIERKGPVARIRLGDDARVSGPAIVALVNETEGRKLHPEGVLELRVSPGAEAIEELRIVLAEIG